jgi:hypothetical protein
MAPGCISSSTQCTDCLHQMHQDMCWQPSGCTRMVCCMYAHRLHVDWIASCTVWLCHVFDYKLLAN